VRVIPGGDAFAPGGWSFASARKEDEETMDDGRSWALRMTPGDILRRFLLSVGLSPDELAEKLHVPRRRIAALVHNTQAITAEIDLRMARYFGLSEGFWLKLQSAYQLFQCRRALRHELAAITPRAEAETADKKVEWPNVTSL
jgi:addiction module HigA family antidote